MKTARNARPDDRRAFLLLVVGACLLYGAGLGRTDLWAPDEPRYGAIAEELRSARHGPRGWVLLHLNDAPYTQKPPLYFWLAAASGIPLGRVDEVAARLPSAIAGVICVALTAWIGRMLFARMLPAILAAGLLATSFRFAFSARRVQLDVLLTACELTAIALFVLLETRRGGIERARRSPLLIAGMHAALGAAALVKGPVGWLPLAVFAGYLAWEGRLTAWRAIAPAWAWLLSLGPLAGWILAAIALAPTGFADAAVTENLLGRFFAGTSHARPFSYYAIQLPIDFLPWSVLVPFAIPGLWRSARRHDETDSRGARPGAPSRLLLAWLAVPLVFFSLSAGKRGLYLLPIFPALALVAVQVGGLCAGTARASGPTVRRMAIAILLVGAVELLGFVVVLPRLHEEKSPRPIAEAATSLTPPGARIGLYGLDPLEGGMLLYGSRPVVSLRDERTMRTFFDDDGRFVVLRARHFAKLRETYGLIELRSFRSGRRRLTLAERLATLPRRE